MQTNVLLTIYTDDKQLFIRIQLTEGNILFKKKNFFFIFMQISNAMTSKCQEWATRGICKCLFISQIICNVMSMYYISIYLYYVKMMSFKNIVLSCHDAKIDIGSKFWIFYTDTKIIQGVLDMSVMKSFENFKSYILLTFN